MNTNDLSEKNKGNAVLPLDRLKARVVKSVTRDKNEPQWETIMYGLEVDDEIVYWIGGWSPYLSEKGINALNEKLSLYNEIVRRINVRRDDKY